LPAFERRYCILGKLGFPMHSATALFLFLCPVLVTAQDYRITTIAGFGTFGGDGLPATAALIGPGAVAVDANGNLFVSDTLNFRIRKIDRSGAVTTLIGEGYGGFSGDGGPASAAAMSTATDLAVDASGNLYFADDSNHRIREITAGGIVSTVAGNGTCGTAQPGMAAAQAPLCDVESVTVDSQGHLYFSAASQIWMVAADGTLVLIAGTGGTGSTGDGGPASSAQVGLPSSMATDQSGHLYFADLYNFVIREVTADKTIHTLVTVTDPNASGIALALNPSGTLLYATGTSQVFQFSQGVSSVAVAVPSPYEASYLAIDRTGAFYLSSLNRQRLIQIAGGSTTVVAGAYPNNSEPLTRPASAVRLKLNPIDAGIAVDASGNVYFPELDDALSQRIDMVSPTGTISAVNSPAKLPTGGAFTVHAVAVGPSGQLYFSTFTQVYRLESGGGVTLIAGAADLQQPLGDGGPATAAKLSNPAALAFDEGGNLYIAEPFDSRVRKVTPQGTITTFAGTGQAGYSGDGGQAAVARLSSPVDVKCDRAGSVYIADLTAAVVRKVDTNGVITTVAGTGTHGFSGDGGPAAKAQLSGPAAIALDPSGNLFIADRNEAAAVFIPIVDNNRIRMVNSGGNITTLAGGFPGYNGEGIQSTLAAMGGPAALAADAQGNIYVEEAESQRVRMLTPVPATSVVITSVNTAGGFPDVAQNDWIEIKGIHLAPASVGANGMVWSNAPEFASGRMPTELSNVSVKVNGKPAFVYFISPAQINVLTPLEDAGGTVSIVVTNGAYSSAPYAVNLRQAAPSFLRFGATGYIAAQHPDYSLLGPAAMSVPGYVFTPAHPGETVLLYAVGFGLPSTPVVNGSATQSGTLALPDIQIGGVPATVAFAGIISPGLVQINMVIPTTAASGDNLVTASFGGVSIPSAALTVVR
jgi:uncharacterized protein (TIGR03437 family)